MEERYVRLCVRAVRMNKRIDSGATTSTAQHHRQQQHHHHHQQQQQQQQQWTAESWSFHFPILLLCCSAFVALLSVNAYTHAWMWGRSLRFV